MQYNTLAKYYDALLTDEEVLIQWLDAFCKKMQGSSILDMGCGSGEAAIILHRKGYHVEAFDLSKQMIDLAKEKSKEIDFQIQDINDFNYSCHFDGILCLMDTMNYFLTKERLVHIFNLVYHHLNEGGLFMFDYHQEQRVEEFKDEYIEEGFVLNIPYQWSIVSKHDDLLEKFVFYQEDGMQKEEHQQRIFSKETLISLLESVGFKVEVETILDEKYMIWGRK